VKLAELPVLDAIIVSHDHYDHLDYPTMLELAKSDAWCNRVGVGFALRILSSAPAARADEKEARPEPPAPAALPQRPKQRRCLRHPLRS
ncbi:MAG TPA: MBL fold metallo-hydrolase, partial [Polyangiaceae bacterium]|nr:MBL fold metallo-hydrolase [Polyangiaceae bacterium]